MSEHANADAGLPQPGDLIAQKYRVERLLGRGGMGAVFAAHHDSLGGRVAIKVLLGESVSSPEAFARFRNEARSAFQIQAQTQHVVRVDDFDQDQGMSYMVLEYLEGEDLANVLRESGPLPYATAIDYVLQALEALSIAHSLNIVHRDLKPSNLFLCKRTGGSIVKVLDFGISKSSNPFNEAASPSLTATGAVLGSPLYMSPEQLRSSKNVDVRTDIWSMGVILYELLTGNVPFLGDTIGELFVAILESSPQPVSSIRPDIPVELDEIVSKCLTRDVTKRYQSAAELAQALASLAPDASRTVLDRISTIHGGLAMPVSVSANNSSQVPALRVPDAAMLQTASTWSENSADTPVVPPKEEPKKKPPVMLLVAVTLLGLAGGVAAVKFSGGSEKPSAAAAGTSTSLSNSTTTSTSSGPSVSANTAHRTTPQPTLASATSTTSESQAASSAPSVVASAPASVSAKVAPSVTATVAPKATTTAAPKATTTTVPKATSKPTSDFDPFGGNRKG